MEFFGVLSWIGFSIWVAVYAGKKDRSVAGYLFLSIILSPIIAGAVVYALDPIEGIGLKKCPRCSEFVKREAKVCRYCSFESPK